MKNRSVAPLMALLVITIGWCSNARAEQIRMNVVVSHPAVSTNGGTVYLKVGLTGFGLSQSDRAPVNLVVVLDRSTSMSGAKIERARQAAKLVVDLLQPRDIFSLVTYDSGVEVLVPATRVTNKARIKGIIDGITPQGMTALYAGVQRGIAEARKFYAKGRVNRIILLSDGMANVGPTSPEQIAALGARAGKHGIAITTVGLGAGYNEDLMTRLANASDGNHGFAATAEDLERVFRAELGDVLAVAAQDVWVEIECPTGVVPLRVLDRQATISGQRITLRLNQLYSRQEKYLLVALKVPASESGSRLRLVTVSARYRNMKTRSRDRLKSSVVVVSTADSRIVASRVQRSVMVPVVEALANEISRKAIVLRDQGKVTLAQNLLQKNARYLDTMSQRYRSKRLSKFGQLNFATSKQMTTHKWNVSRKRMRKAQYRMMNQMSW